MSAGAAGRAENRPHIRKGRSEMSEIIRADFRPQHRHFSQKINLQPSTFFTPATRSVPFRTTPRPKHASAGESAHHMMRMPPRANQSCAQSPAVNERRSFMLVAASGRSCDSLVPRHSDFDGLISSHSRMGRVSGATSISMLRGTPG